MRGRYYAKKIGIYIRVGLVQGPGFGEPDFEYSHMLSAFFLHTRVLEVSHHGATVKSTCTETP
jgi:hypothetical protein